MIMADEANSARREDRRRDTARRNALRTTWLYLYHLGELDHSVIASVDELAEVFLAIGQQVNEAARGNRAQ